MSGTDSARASSVSDPGLSRGVMRQEVTVNAPGELAQNFSLFQYSEKGRSRADNAGISRTFFCPLDQELRAQLGHVRSGLHMKDFIGSKRQRTKQVLDQR